MALPARPFFRSITTPDSAFVMKSRVAALLSFATTFLAALPTAAADSKPNVIHIVADDLGWKDVGFNGATDLKTPNLDALAQGGAKLRSFYVQPM